MSKAEEYKSNLNMWLNQEKKKGVLLAASKQCQVGRDWQEGP